MSGFKLKISDFQRHIQNPITTPNNNYSKEEKVKIAKASRDFESLLTSMMIKSMTKSTNGLFGEGGYGGDVLDTVFEQEMAKYMSQGSGMGVANVLYKKMTGEELSSDAISTKSYEKTLSKISDADKTLPSVSPSKNSLNRLGRYEKIVEQAAKKYGVSKNLIKSIILTESAANEKAISKVKAKGLMQLMDSTAVDMGVKNVWDPKQNIFGGTKYISKMLKKYNGDVKMSLAAYNAGPGNVEKYNGVPPFEETQNYISRVFGYLNHFEG